MLSTVFCSTGTILYGKGYGKRSNGGEEDRTRAARLVGGEVVEVVHHGATQVAEDEPENGLEDFFGCWRHAERVSQLDKGSRIIGVNVVGGAAILRYE